MRLPFIVFALAFGTASNSATAEEAKVCSDGTVTTTTSKIDKVSLSHSDKHENNLLLTDENGGPCKVQFILYGHKDFPANCTAGATVTATGQTNSEYALWLENVTDLHCE